MKGCSNHTRGSTLGQLNINIPSLSLLLTMEYLFFLSVSILPKRFLYTSWQHQRSCHLLSFQLRISSQSVSVAQIVHAICQQFRRPVVPSARRSASESRPCACTLLQMLLSPGEQANRLLPILTILVIIPLSSKHTGPKEDKKLYNLNETVSFDFVLPLRINN